MSRIIEFPTKSVRDWAQIEKTLRNLLAQANVSAPVVDIVTERMKDAVAEHQFEYSMSVPKTEHIPVEVNHQIADFAQALQRHSHNLLLSRLKLEVRLAQAEGYG